jgi:hypothetical protein
MGFSVLLDVVVTFLVLKKNFKKGVNSNENVTLLPNHLFACKIYLNNNFKIHRQVSHYIYNTPIESYPKISNP